MPLLTSTIAGQGSDKGAEKGYKETWVTTGVNHDERGARSHSVDLTLEQERVSRAQYDTCDTYGWGICKQYGTIMHKQDMHERTSYTSFHYCQHIGQPFSNFLHIVLSL